MICSVVMGALTLQVSNCSIAPIFCRPFCVVDGSAAWSFAPMQRRLRSAFSVADTSVRLRVKLERGLEGPLLPLNVDHSDTVFVLKVKIEIALRLLQDTGNLRSKVVPKAEEIELEFRGVPLRDMMAIDREDGDPLQLREVPQEIGHRHLVSQHQLPIQLVEDMGTALLVKAVEERSAGDALVHGVAKHLEEVTTAGGL